VSGKATVEEINKAFGRFAMQATPEDAVYVVLIGHGSYDGKIAKFNLPGPDISALDFATQFRRLPAKQIVFVNTTSASGPFVNELSGPGRTIITAHPQRRRELRDALRRLLRRRALGRGSRRGQEPPRDDARGVPVCEGRRAARLRQGRPAVDRARRARRQRRQGGQSRPVDDRGGRQVAALMAIGSAADAMPLPTDPKLRALVLERRDLEHRVESLRLLKDNMDPAKYQSELEKLVTDLALKTREIRTLEGAK
jgi:hypothetical protein